MSDIPATAKDRCARPGPVLDIQDKSFSNHPVMARPIAMTNDGSGGIFILLADGDVVECHWDCDRRAYRWGFVGNVEESKRKLCAKESA